MYARLACLFLSAAIAAHAAVKIEKTAYGGWPNCYRITNGEVELIVTSDVGPRIIRYAFVGGKNIFKEFAPEMGKSGEKEWTPRGGHRLWMGPEDRVETYALDNGPVKVNIKGDALETIQPVEKETGLEKRLVIKLAPTGSQVEIQHYLTNRAQKARTLAPWTLTMMAPGGMGFTGFPPRGQHPAVLAPTNPLVMWAFTDLSDKRWKFTQKYLMLRQDVNAPQPQKIGHYNPQTWGAYLLGTDLFIKRSAGQTGKAYPDFGCSFETFSSKDFLELETLGPLGSLAPGATVDHTERWSLHKNIRLSAVTDQELDRIFLPLLK